MRKSRFAAVSSLVLIAGLMASSTASAAPSAPTLVANFAKRPWVYSADFSAAVTAPLARTALQAAGFEARGRRVLAELAQLCTSETNLELRDIVRADGDTFVRFRETYRGLPVLSGGAVARLDAQGRARFASRAQADIAGIATTPAVTQDAARKAAQELVHVDTSRAATTLVVSFVYGAARLVWLIEPGLDMRLRSQPEILVDAQTGEVVQVEERLRAVQSVRMYPANPNATPALALLPMPIAGEDGKLANPFIKSLNCVDRKSLKQVNFGVPIDMHVCDLEESATANEEGNFDFTPNDVAGSTESQEDTFSQASIFYHSGRAYQFFRDLQGVPEAKVVANAPLNLVANLRLPPGLASGNLANVGKVDLPLDPLSNAFFSPGGNSDAFGPIFGIRGGSLFFGQGPKRDYAYDGDVVYHEFTHAVVDDTLKLTQFAYDAYGITAAPGAMNEGLSDYFSSAITGDPDVGEYASKDISQNTSVIRTLSNNDSCPSRISGAVHSDSTLFSGGLWSARMSQPEAERRAFDKAIYKAMLSNAGQGALTYEELTEFFLKSLRIDLPAGAAALEAEMRTRGVLPKCTRVFEYVGKAISAPNYGSRRDGFAAPGRSATGLTGNVPGMLQVAYAIPAGSTSVRVTFEGASTGGQGLGGGSRPFAPVVLARFGAPLEWKVKAGKPASNEDALVVATGTAAFEAVVPVTEGATQVYVQIANKGDDGIYQNITLKGEGGNPPVLETDAGAPDGSPGNGAIVGGSVGGGGCSCNVGPSGASSAIYAPLAALAAAAIAALRRLRARKNAR